MAKETGTDNKQQSFVNKDFLENVLIENRIIFLYGIIDNELAEDINKKLAAFHLIDKKLPILIEINSGGGSCSDGLSIIDSMMALGNPIITRITGHACSMATYISVCGDLRFIAPNAFWMTHPMSTWEGDYLKFVKDGVVQAERLDKRLDMIYKKQCKLSKADFTKFQNGELWLNAKECLARKIVDKIG